MSDNKVVVVAGAGPGNGAALAQRFAAAGRQVAMLSRDQEHVEALAAKITGARGYACDVSDEHFEILARWKRAALTLLGWRRKLETHI